MPEVLSVAAETGTKLTPRTASKHVAAILAKLDVETRTAAATYAVRHGLA